MNGSKRFNLEQYIRDGIDKFLASEEYVRGITLGTIDASDIDCIIDYTYEDDIMYSAKIQLYSKRDLKKTSSFSHKSYFINVLEINVDASFLYTNIDYNDCNFANNHIYKVNIISDKYKDYSQIIDITQLDKWNINIDISKYAFKEKYRARRASFITSHIKNNIAQNISYEIRFPFDGSLECIGWLYKNSVVTNSIEYNMGNYREEDLDIYNNLAELLELFDNTTKGNNIFKLNINYGYMHSRRDKKIEIDRKLISLLNDLIGLFDVVNFNLE